MRLDTGTVNCALEDFLHRGRLAEGVIEHGRHDRNEARRNAERGCVSRIGSSSHTRLLEPDPSGFDDLRRAFTLAENEARELGLRHCHRLASVPGNPVAQIARGDGRCDALSPGGIPRRACVREGAGGLRLRLAVADCPPPVRWIRARGTCMRHASLPAILASNSTNSICVMGG